MENIFPLAVMPLLFAFTVGMLAGLAGRRTVPTVVVQTLAQPQSNGGLAVALFIIAAVWMVIAAVFLST